MQVLTWRNWPGRPQCALAVWKLGSKPTPLHTHDHPELFWIESGQGIHDINGQPKKIESGYFSLIRSDDVHRVHAASSDTPLRLVNITFRQEIWDRVKTRYFQREKVFFDRKDIHDREFMVGSDVLERLRVLASDLTAGAGDLLSGEAFVTGVLAMLANLSRLSATHAQAPDWLAEAVDRIRRFPHFTQGVPEFVRLAGRSHEHTSRECRRAYGKSPRDFVNDARLRWATSQLAATEMGIVDVAMESGFENLGHFYKLFHKVHGMTPARYRNRFASKVTDRQSG